MGCPSSEAFRQKIGDPFAKDGLFRKQSIECLAAMR
jgi:hypothetical protein